MVHSPYQSRLLELTRRVLNDLMPIYLHQATSDSAGSEVLPRASFLDGLRGYASLVVFVSHFFDPFQPAKRFGYGYGQGNDWLLQLPIIRVLYSGVPMVSIFFVISGYALSLKPLSHIRTESWDHLADTMASSTFRRGIRLFLPTLATTFLVMVSVLLDLHDASDYASLPGVIEPRPRPFPRVHEQLYDWCHFVTTELTNPWQWQVRDYVYDSHLWTIPIEFRASMILFMFLTCISRFRLPLRLALASAFWAYCMFYAMWHVALFICGACFADLSFERRPTELKPFRHLLCALPSLALGLYLLSFPIRNGPETSGYISLSMITANHTIWHTFGAMLVLFTLGNSEVLQGMFSTPFAAYLGKISYALYLVHGPALHTFGYGTVSSIWSVFGKDTWIQYQGGLLLGFLLVGPVVLWWADIFERLVDRPSVELARWLYLKGVARN